MRCLLHQNVLLPSRSTVMESVVGFTPELQWLDGGDTFVLLLPNAVMGKLHP